MDSIEDCWRVLELRPTDDVDELKRAYREQALTWHPDRFPYDESLRRRCEERMREVNAAYEALLEALEAGVAVPPPEPKAEPPWPRARQAEPAPEPAEEASTDVEAWRPRSPAEEEAELRALQEPPAWTGLQWIGAALALAAAALLAFFVLPYGDLAPYATAMRVVASPALAYAALAAFARNGWEFGLGWGLLALALNPLFPMPMPLEDWRVFNAVTPALLAGMWLLMSRMRPRE